MINGEVRNTKRLLLTELIIFLTLAGTTALLFRPLMGVINKNIDIVRETIIRQGESFLGRPIRYGSLSPSLLGMVEIRNLRVGGEADPLLSIKRFYLEYSLWDLLRGRGVGSVRNLVVEDPELRWDMERDKDIPGLFRQEKKSALKLPPECHFLLSGGSFSFSKGRNSIAASRIYLEGEITEGRIKLEGNWHKDAQAGISLEGTVQGNVSSRFDDGTILLGVDSIEGKGFAVDRLAFTLSLFKERILFEHKRTTLPMELMVEYFPGTGNLSGVFRPEQLLPGDTARFYGPLESFSVLLGLRLSGELAFSLNAKKPEDKLEYHFDLSALHETQGRNIPVRSLAIRGRGDEKHLNFSRFHAEANRGSVSYTGEIYFNPFFLQGSLGLSAFSITGDSSVNGSISFSQTAGGFALGSQALSLGGVPLSLAGTMTREGKTEIGVLYLHPQTEGGGDITLAGSFTEGGRGDKPALEGNLELTDMQAADLWNMARPFVNLGKTGLADKTVLSFDLFFSTDFERFSYRSSRFRAVFGGNTFVSASLEGTDRMLAVSNGVVSSSRTEAAFALNAGFSPQGEAEGSLTVSYRGLAYAFEGRIRNKTLRLTGSYGFALELQNRSGSWNGSASAAGFPLPRGGSYAYLTFDSAIRYRNFASWNVGLDRFEIRDSRGSSFSLHGRAGENGLNLESIVYKDEEGSLEGSAAAVWDSGFSVIDASFFLSDSTEKEKLSGEVFYEAGMWEFHTTAVEFNIDRFITKDKNLRLSGECFGSLNEEGRYSLNLSLASLSGRNGGNVFNLSGLALIDPEQLILSRIHFTMAGVEAEIPYLALDRGAGNLATEGRAQGRINDQNLGINASLGINFRPPDTWMDMANAVESFSGVFEVRHAYINKRESTDPFRFVFSRTPGESGGPGAFRLSGGPENMVNLEFLETGDGGILSAAFSAPSPVQASITGILEGTTMDVLVREVYIDLPGLWEIIPVGKTVNFSGGFITGETRIYGSIFDPEFDGLAWGSGVALTVPDYVAAEIGPGSGAIILEGSDISFGPVAASCGEGGGLVSGWVRFNRWVPSISVTIEADREIPFDFNISGVIARGKAGGILNILMENDEVITITGDVTADDTELTLNDEEIKNAAARNRTSDKDIIADIHVSAGRRVEFLWPDPRSPLLRAYAEMGTGLQFMGDTRIPHFALEGDLRIRGGELYQLQRNFYIREGLLHFSGADLQVNPRISATAELRDRNNDGPVTIFMIVENTSLSALLPQTGPANPEDSPREVYVPRFESSPSLSQLEIYNILGQAPFQGAAVEAQNLRPFINTSTEIILQSLIFRRVERPIRSILGLDMFSFRTQIIQNAIFEAVREREPDERSGMGNYLDNTAVFLGKYIGQDLFFQTTLAFRYDQYRKEYAGMRLEPDVGLDFRTPLFDIRWNLHSQAPQNFLTGNYTDPVGDAVSGQSISLVWRWSW